MRKFAVAALVLTLVFAWPLAQLARFAWGSTLYSHIVLIPLVSIGLVLLGREPLGGPIARARRIAAVPPMLVALALIAAVVAGAGWTWPIEEYLAATTGAFVLLLLSSGLVFLGAQSMREFGFPLAFLVFMIPLPPFVTDMLETFLQHGSAWVAQGLFSARGTPYLYHDLVIELPGITLQVAPECSGIHSTLVLFITSVLAAHLILRTTWRRCALVLFVVPLALIRNGFRIFVIGELCVRIDPEMIHSWVHKRGGPLFFALSLIPFLLVLVLLRRSEQRHAKQAAAPAPAPQAPSPTH